MITRQIVRTNKKHQRHGRRVTHCTGGGGGGDSDALRTDKNATGGTASSDGGRDTAWRGTRWKKFKKRSFRRWRQNISATTGLLLINTLTPADLIICVFLCTCAIFTPSPSSLQHSAAAVAMVWALVNGWKCNDNMDNIWTSIRRLDLQYNIIPKTELLHEITGWCFLEIYYFYEKYFVGNLHIIESRFRTNISVSELLKYYSDKIIFSNGLNSKRIRLRNEIRLRR